MKLIKHQGAGPWVLGGEVLSENRRGRRIRPVIPGYGLSRKRTSPTMGNREGLMEEATLQQAGL